MSKLPDEIESPHIMLQWMERTIQRLNYASFEEQFAGISIVLVLFEPFPFVFG